ncbi:PREDICTED: uncharacterized protein LOC102876811 [Elephantulus edwardii]|uniref:uncharacterized protein LOC102876811 n=1 Tax=Elephantulus edwardii TaxID=28737 RepID=UPI0003F08211|nr:PREDICTED: uncharacterized protein LOC102876811 [Elephantulus edwardii]
MSGHHVGRPNTYGRLNHSSSLPNPSWSSGWTHYRPLPGTNSFKRTLTPRGSEISSCSSPSEWPASSPRLPLRRICMGQSYNSKSVETNHLANGPKVARKVASHDSTHCLMCADQPSTLSSPTFLDQLIKGINYLDRAANSFCPKTMVSLPKLAASYLERATSSFHLDQPDPPSQHSYSNPGNMATPDAPSTTTSNSIVPMTRGASALQCMDNATNVGYTHRISSRNLTPPLQQRPELKLPDLPLLSNGIFSLGRLPKFWEAISSGWCAPEPISKPSSWW